MKAKIRHLVIGVLMLTTLIQPSLVTAGIPEAVTYLESQVDDTWITMALVTAGQTGIPTGYLSSVSGTLATDYSKAILALAALGQDPSTFGNSDYVAQLKNHFDGTQIGDANLQNDDIWAILALASVGEVNSSESQTAKDFLLANQNIDGGWGYSVGSGSDTNDTAAAVMALMEAGISATDSVITNALSYIQSAQNSDGGIGYTPGSDSDSGSDSWTISALYKAGIDPATWNQGSNNPITHLESLQDEDGGFWWVQEGTSEWNNKAMTAYAVIALAGETYPVGYYTGQTPDPDTYHLRIEGSNSTICDTYINATTALDIVENAAEVCSYTYNIEETIYGLYLNTINDNIAEGTKGWLYFVNNNSLSVGATDYNLKSGDEVLWYFGDWGWPPTKLSIDETEIDPGQNVNLTAQYFNGSDWLPLPNAIIKVNNVDHVANGAGILALEIVENGAYQLYIEMPEFVRSEKITVTVGDTISQNVGLQVEIDQSSGGRIGGEAIALVVNPAQINFGTLAPGEASSQTVTLENAGTVGLTVGASVTGDTVFISGLAIDDNPYDQYSKDLVPSAIVDADVSLTVPESYLASGVKNGELIFWATSQ